LFALQQDLVRHAVCSDEEATEIVNKNCMSVVSQQQLKFEQILESFDVNFKLQPNQRMTVC